jgi:hypothetical protein
MKILQGFTTEENARQRSNEMWVLNSPVDAEQSALMFTPLQNTETKEWGLYVPDEPGYTAYLSDPEKSLLIEGSEWPSSQIPI